jgi:hypothetical protein
MDIVFSMESGIQLWNPVRVGGNVFTGQYVNDPCGDDKVNFKVDPVTDEEGKLLPF